MSSHLLEPEMTLCRLIFVRITGTNHHFRKEVALG